MRTNKTKICHVCGKEKKPYTVILTNDIFSFLQYNQAREDGPICERCDQYHAMTNELKDATKEEFEIAEKAAWFSYMLLKWWENGGKINPDKKNLRDWGGTAYIAKWCREYVTKN